MIADHAPPLRAIRPRPRHLGRYLLAGAAALLAAWTGAAWPSGMAPAGARTVVVAPGQSLWGIAEGQLPDDDPRVAVEEIVRLNGLRSSVLQPGEVLTLPPH